MTAVSVHIIIQVPELLYGGDRLFFPDPSGRGIAMRRTAMLNYIEVRVAMRDWLIQHQALLLRRKSARSIQFGQCK